MKGFCGSELWVIFLFLLTQNVTLWCANANNHGIPYQLDPNITSQEDPDLTECFQLTLLVWVPCAFLLLFTPLELFYIKTSRKGRIPWGLNNVSKLFGLILLIALSIVDLVMAVTKADEFPEEIFDVHFTTPAVRIFTFLVVGIVVLLQKKKGIRSSGLKFLFWLLLVLCAIIQYRTEIRYIQSVDSLFVEGQSEWRDYKALSYMIYFPLITVSLLLNCVSDKAPINQKRSQKASPEVGASFLRKLTFQWFDPTAWNGYRRPLVVEDMYDLMDEDASETLVPPFDKYFEESIRKNGHKLQGDLKKGKKNTVPLKSGETNGSVLPAMVKAFGAPFWFAGFIKLFMDILSFASPTLLGSLIGFTGSNEPLWLGLIYALGFFGVAFLTAFLNGQYSYMSFKVGFRIRTALVSAIYRKALRISSSAKKDSTVGEIVNLMAVDAQRFMELTSYLHFIWSGPFIIALALYFLYQLLGVATFVGLAILIIMIPVNVVIASKMRSYQIAQMKEKDGRVKVMNEVLNGMKVLKLYGWEPSFEKSITEVRNKEIKILETMTYYASASFFAWTLTPFLVTLGCFATFVLMDENNVLDANITFQSLALLNILRAPMAMFPQIIAMVMQAWVAITRINNFMNKKELDPNTVTHQPSQDGIKVTKGVFNWDDDEDTLKDINMTIEKKSLVAVVGPVGCGKSSLISAILGEMEKKSGTVNTDGSIAYVAQQAWIQNCTLKDNILFGKPFDAAFYDKVVEACALKPDLEMLPGGDQTEIGEKGINLSGGQKQRIALARAVYANADIYLLDDPLSAVDAHVGKHIFDNVVGPKGVLAGKTRLLVTHGVSFLPQMDSINVMVHGGITESGSYRDLLAQKGAFSEFLVTHLTEVEDEEELLQIQEVLGDKPEAQALLQRAMSIRSTSSSGSIRSRKKRVSRQTSTSSRAIVEERPKQIEKVGTQLIAKEESATGSIGFRVYLRYFKSIGKFMAPFSIFMIAAHQGLAVYSNMWLSNWSSDPASAEPSVRDKYLGVYGGLGGIQAISLFVGSVLFGLGCVNATKFLHQKLLSHVFRLPMSFYDTTPLGRILNRFSRDVDTVDNILPMAMRSYITMICSVVGTLVVISYSTPIFMAVIVPIAIIYFLIQVFYVATTRQLKRIESVTRSPIYSHFSESLSGQMTIRAYDKDQEFIQDNAKKVDFNQKCYYPSIVANRWLAVRLELVGSLIVLFAALFAVLGRDTVDPSIVGLSVSYALSITQIMAFMVRMSAEIETNIVSIERLEEYSDLEQEAAWKKGEIDPTWPKDGKVQFKDLQVRYREGLDLVLKGISFEVESSQKIGIVGRTGAGKSSLTLALFRIIEAAGGKIVIDGKDINELGLHNLRSRLTIIPQDPVLFSGTLRMNLDPFDFYSDDEVWNALELSHLKAFVKTLPTGLLHEISEGGENLSVGQRQLVCLARALLRKTKVLILDEATAAVDLETDDLIQKTIRTEFSDCTILTIAHRLNTIIDSDKVVVLDKGLIAEFDSPQNLMNDPTTIFYGMAKNSGLIGNDNNNNTSLEAQTENDETYKKRL